MLKNNINIILQKLSKYLNKPWVLFIIFSLIGAFIFFMRFPNNFYEPNFYAEDGSIFLLNIERYGFMGALLTTFNGYYVFGMYLLEGIGYVINLLTFGHFIDLARSFAITSYLFLGAVCALPILLFKNKWGFLTTFLVFILSVFIPMPGYDYAIIGTIGNLKFIFVYLAFLLMIYRHIAPEKSLVKIICIDIIIAICAYTNVVVYLLLPFATLKYLPFLHPKKLKLKKLIRLHSFQSLIVLGLLLIPQIIIIKIYGLTIMAGYLDTPYQWGSTINLFIFRPFIYPFTTWSTIHMTDIFAICIFCILSLFLWFNCKKYKEILIFGYFTIFLTTLLFVINRTGISELYINYLSGGGPDQFFYTQNLIICFLLGISISIFLNKFQKIVPIRVSLLALLIVVALIYAPSAGTYGKNDFMQSTVKNIYTQAQYECNQKGSIDIQLYPANIDSFKLKNLNRNEICNNNLAKYIPDTEYINETTADNSYLPDISKTLAYQTFHSNYNDLSGISIMFLTYGQKIKDSYYLNLYKSDCSTLIKSYSIKRDSLQDAVYDRIAIDKINNSKNKDYCFSILTNDKVTTPLAIPLSKLNQYSNGNLIINNATRVDDFMIRLHYTK